MGYPDGDHKSSYLFREDSGMRKDDAVAPVVAVLLILAVIVTFMSLYYTTYVPSLKEQAEIDHMHQIENGFLSFSSHIENAVWKKSEGTLSQRIPLGGGDVFLSGLKSGGVLKVEKDSDLFGMTDDSGICRNSSIISFSYEPVNNFWENQGYSWQFGYVNLTTEYGKSTPLEFSDMDTVCEYVKNSSGLFPSLFDMDYTKDVVYVYEDGNFTGTTYKNCSDIEITVVNFITGENDYTSGNGIGKLNLDSKKEYINMSTKNMTLKVYENIPLDAGIPIWKKINSELENLENENFYNIEDVTWYEEDTLDTNLNNDMAFEFNTSVGVKINYINLTVSVI